MIEAQANERDSYWHQYWASRTTTPHRWETEEFLQKEAREKLFHLGGGHSILDFGCGSGDLLAYYAKEYRTCVGVDFSESVLQNARTRLEAQGCPDSVALILADDVTVWEKLPPSAFFDRITTSGVVQYFSRAQIERFLHEAAKKLTPDGKVVLFDVIDPRLYWMFEVGILSRDNGPCPSWLRVARRLLRLHARALRRRLRGLPPFEIGSCYHPAVIKSVAEGCGLVMQYVTSMYYNYRYHALLRPAAGAIGS